MATVAVAVKAGGGTLGEDASRGAVKWAVEKLMEEASRFVLVHVVPTITSIPTPSGQHIPIGEVDANTADTYVKDKYLVYQEVFVPFKKLCKKRKIETLVLQGDDPASELVKFVAESGVHCLVLGFRNTTFNTRRLRDSTVARAVLDRAPQFCNIVVVSKGKQLNHSGAPSSPGGSSPRSSSFNHRESSSRSSSFNHRESSSLRNSELGGSQYAFSVDREVTLTASSVSSTSTATRQPKPPNRSRSVQEGNHKHSRNIISEFDATNGGPSVASTRTKQAEGEEQGIDSEVDNAATSLSNLSYANSISTAPRRRSRPSSVQERNHQNLGNSSILEGEEENECASVASAETKQLDSHTELEQLRQELMATVGLYNQAFEDFVHAQNEVHFLSSNCLEEERQVNAALRREEAYKKIAADEKRKHLEAIREIERARKLLEKQTRERDMAAVEAAKLSLEKKQIMDALLSNDRRYRRYTTDEIEKATDSFSEAKLIGEGSYGKVYRCVLDETPVAVKVLRSDAPEKKMEEFLTEVDVLCKLRHPHIVLLLGACPEIGCLVFEYMENGSLDHYVSVKSNKDPLPWFVRFRIAFEIACGLAFLHNTKPDPIIHRDLKPGNIFLDRYYVSKIGDVGLAKLVSNVTPDNVTAYSDSVIFGSLYYVDPEYHRTGTVRPKSDLYGFGMIILQLLAAQHPDGLLLKFEAALANGMLSDLLDKSISDWPLAESEELANMALKCSRLRCRDRPDLEMEVLPLLKRLADMADDTLRVQKNSIHPPNHFFCPILQRVMEDPYIAADGFTYEHRAIQEWLNNHKHSPVTKNVIEDPYIAADGFTYEHRAIQEWLNNHKHLPVTKVRLQHTMLIQNHSLRSAIED